LIPLLLFNRPPVLDVLVLVGFAGFLYGLASSDGIIARILASRPFVFLGEISYSVYLVHALVIVACKAVLSARPGLATSVPLDSVGIVLLFILLTITSGATLYYTVETPGRRLVRRIADQVSRVDTK
jgi:peptidoglycan/LPS O-acetylase OafA/YrhL